MRAADFCRRCLFTMAMAAIACGDTSAYRLFEGDRPADGGVHSGGADASSPPPPSGCTKDTDCKGDRICEQGMCVAPGGGTGGNVAASGGNAPSAGGGRGDGGSQASGGRPSTGGTAMAGTSNGGTSSGGTSSGGTSSGGAATGGTGSGGKPAMCPVGQKPCDNKCVAPTPAVGCDLVSCTPCTAAIPAHGYAICENSQCSFDCLAGYIKAAGSCYLVGGSGGFGFGGYGGYGGYGAYGGRFGAGGAGQCNVDADCHNTCNVSSGPPCCTTSGKCGCLLLPVPGTCN